MAGAPDDVTLDDLAEMTFEERVRYVRDRSVYAADADSEMVADAKRFAARAAALHAQR